MELKGKIIQVLEEKSGTSSRGPWRKQEYVIEIPGDYPKKVCFMVWGDKIDEFKIAQGNEMTVHFDIESREYNGRWYTDVKAWKVDQPQPSQASGPDHGLGQNIDEPPMWDEQPPMLDDEIPF